MSEWDVPDWLLIIRATWGDPKVMREAAAEIFRRNLMPDAREIELSARPSRHRRMLEEALVAE